MTDHAPEALAFAKMTQPRLEEAIERLSQMLSAARRALRAKKGGLAAAGRSRKMKVSPAHVIAIYLEQRGVWDTPARGALRDTLAQLPTISQRTVSRILKDHRSELERQLELARRKQSS